MQKYLHPHPASLATVLFCLGLFAAGPQVSAQGTLFVEGDRVGIGTPTPASALHLYGTSGTTSILVHEDSSTEAIRDGLQLVNNGRVQFRLRDLSADGGNPWVFATREGGFQINELSDGGQTDFSLNAAGDLIIAGSLFTNGGAESFPDYVFDPAYELMPLEKLKSYIARKRHLPNLPSAETVARQGRINMSELQLDLLEKVEELTLYVLQLKEETDDLRAENAALREEVINQR